MDSSVLLDVLGADPKFGERSREALRAAYNAGALMACEIVLSEVRAHFSSEKGFLASLKLLGIEFDPISRETAGLAGRYWRQHRGAHPAGRDRVIADFLVGAHACTQADGLLTRDRGFYRQYFDGLLIIDPSEK